MSVKSTLPQMNTLRMLALAGYLSNVPKRKFYMGTWIVGSNPNGTLVRNAEEFQTCGTSACIAGYAAILFTPANVSFRSFDSTAQEYLGLTIAEAEHLFKGHWSRNGLEEEDPKAAAKEIRRMVKAYEAGKPTIAGYNIRV